MPAFEELHARHAGRVTAYLLPSGFARPDADDLCQETFLRAFKSMHTFDPARGTPAGWLAAIARNVARRRWERRKSPSNFDPELAEEMLADDNPNPGGSSEAREEIDAVRSCVEALPPELGGVVRLRYVEGRTTRGVAAATGIPESTVRSLLGQARVLLEKCLRGKGVVE